jgi:hypothetical protein
MTRNRVEEPQKNLLHIHSPLRTPKVTINPT